MQFQQHILVFLHDKVFCHLLVYLLLNMNGNKNHCGEVFNSRKSCKTSKNTVKSLKIYHLLHVFQSCPSRPDWRNCRANSGSYVDTSVLDLLEK